MHSSALRTSFTTWSMKLLLPMPMMCVQCTLHIHTQTRVGEWEAHTNVPWKSNKMWHKTILPNVDKIREKKRKNRSQRQQRQRQGKRNWTASSEINGWVVEPSSAPYIQYSKIILPRSIYDEFRAFIIQFWKHWSNTSERSVSFSLVSVLSKKIREENGKTIYRALYQNWCICLEKHNPKLLR